MTAPWSPETAILLALIIPAVAAIGIEIADRQANLRESVSLAAGVLLFVVVATLTPMVLDGGRPSLVLAEFVPGIELAFEVEPLGMLFALVASGLWPIASLYSIGYMRGNQEHAQTRFYICFAIAIAATIGVAFSANLLTLFIFYEVLTLSTYPLVTHNEDEEARMGGRTYLGILLATSIGLLLPGILWVYATTGTLDFQPGGILEGHIDGLLVGLMLFLFMFGIGKAALMPIHRWLPAAMVAPTPVSALLHAVAVVKAGVFTVIKVITYTFGVDFLAQQASANWLLYIAGFTVIAASVVALRQDHLKRRLAYSTVSQLSYVVMAAALFTPIAIVGAAMHLLAHAVSKITLFFAAGSIHTAAHKDYVSQLDGIGRRMPWTMGAFAVGAFSLIGIPPAIGVASKWYIVQGAFVADQAFVAGVLLISTLLNAAYFLPVVYVAFFRKEDNPGHGHGEQEEGDDEHHHHDHGEAPLPIVIAITLTALATVTLFFFPDPAIALARAVAGL